ncbi:MAG TPA: sigma-70 family RNA polymerase sigma factor [Gaiellaceae bacterium]|nr:sigma-70 family RNA polymerase sigma factor [Gaiellaceae bacterium]
MPGALTAEDLRRLHREAQARRPGVHVDEATFAAAFSARRDDGAPDALHAADLLLALGCLAGDPGALALFEAEHVDGARRALGRLRLDASTVDDIVQRVRAKILVGSGAGPRLASYSARGPLSGWVRAIAVHEAMSARRAEVRRGPHDGPSAIERIPIGEEPELAQLRATYAAPFKAAFGEALGGLAPRDRNVLRLVYVDGLTADQVGLAYGVHRVSVARWLQQIRAALFSATKKLLSQRLRLSPTEFESVTRLCLSQIDVSLDRLLADLEPSASPGGVAAPDAARERA